MTTLTTDAMIERMKAAEIQSQSRDDAVKQVLEARLLEELGPRASRITVRQVSCRDVVMDDFINVVDHFEYTFELTVSGTPVLAGMVLDAMNLGVHFTGFFTESRVTKGWWLFKRTVTIRNQLTAVGAVVLLEG